MGKRKSQLDPEDLPDAPAAAKSNADSDSDEVRTGAPPETPRSRITITISAHD